MFVIVAVVIILQILEQKKYFVMCTKKQSTLSCNCVNYIRISSKEIVAQSLSNIVTRCLEKIAADVDEMHFCRVNNRFHAHTRLNFIIFYTRNNIFHCVIYIPLAYIKQNLDKIEATYVKSSIRYSHFT